MGYLNAYKSYHNIKHITIITPPGRKELCGFYSGYDKMLVLSYHQYTGLAYMASVPIGRFINLHSKRIRHIAFALYLNRSLLFDNPILKANECTKMILKIPGSSELKEPTVPDIEVAEIVKKYHLSKKRTVMINPYTSGISVQELDEVFYQTLATILKQHGFQVITVLGSPSQRSVEGTEGVVTSLAEAWHLAEYCGWIIGTRSGFFDFIQHAKCNAIVLYDGKYRQRDFFAIEQHDRDKQVFEFTYEDDYMKLASKIADTVLQFSSNEKENNS